MESKWHRFHVLWASNGRPHDVKYAGFDHKLTDFRVFGGFGAAVGGDFERCRIRRAAAQNPRGFVIPNRGFAPPG